MTSGAWNPSNVPYERMSTYYRGIRECNIFLANIEAFPASNFFNPVV